jgi:hypothetical protein
MRAYAVRLCVYAESNFRYTLVLAADRNVASMILRIILSLLFEHGANIIGPQFGWPPSSDGANASAPRRDMHHEKAEQNSR